MAELDTEGRKELPDGDFAFPEQRKMPLSDAAHVRNAVARFDQVVDVTDKDRDGAWKRIRAAAERFGIELGEKDWRELKKPD